MHTLEYFFVSLEASLVSVVVHIKLGRQFGAVGVEPLDELHVCLELPVRQLSDFEHH